VRFALGYDAKRRVVAVAIRRDRRGEFFILAQAKKLCCL